MENKGLPVRYVRLLAELLEKRGISPERLYREAGISPVRIAAPGNLLPVPELDRLIGAARALSGDDRLAFETGLAIRVTSHDQLGLGMLSAATYEQSLKMLARYFHLFTPLFRARFQPTFHHAWFSLTPAADMPRRTLDFLLEALAVSFQSQTRMLLGGDDAAYDIHLSLEEPVHAGHYARLSPTRFHFGNPQVPGILVHLPSQLLHTPLPMADARMAEECEQRCSELQAAPQAGQTGWRNYISMLLRASGGMDLTLERIAERTRISVRTLERNLKREGVTFRELSAEIRIAMACDILRDPGSRVAQVAARLGFSDAANFTRAFKRQVGVSPLDYKNRHAEAAGDQPLSPVSGSADPVSA